MALPSGLSFCLSLDDKEEGEEKRNVGGGVGGWGGGSDGRVPAALLYFFPVSS